MQLPVDFEKFHRVILISRWRKSTAKGPKLDVAHEQASINTVEYLVLSGPSWFGTPTYVRRLHAGTVNVADSRQPHCDERQHWDR